MFIGFLVFCLISFSLSNISLFFFKNNTNKLDLKPAYHERYKDESNESKIEKEMPEIEDLMIKKISSYKDNYDNTIKETTIIKDFADEPFILIEFNEGYCIYSFQINDFLEMGPFAISPFKRFPKYFTDFRYIYMNGYYALNILDDNVYEIADLKNPLTDKDKENLYDISKIINATLSKECNECKSNDANDNFMMHIGKKNQKNDQIPWTNDPIFNLITADKEVPYSWYFKYNVNQFSTNNPNFYLSNDGICGYTALSMILTYNEVFKSPGYFSSNEAIQYITHGVGIFGQTVPEIDDFFPRDIWGGNIGSSTPSIIHEAVDTFLINKDKLYDHYDFVTFFSNIYDPIKDGVPAIYFGNFNLKSEKKYGHAVVAYGSFDDGKLLCHWGWEGGGYSQVIAYKLGLFNEGGVYALYNKSPHYHKSYFIDENGNHRCGCGVTLC